MGLPDNLGFETKPPKGFQRTIQRVASSRPGAWILSKTLFAVDKALFRLTGGRLTLTYLMAGLPVIMLTTTGAKTGKKRTTPLIGISLGNDLAVIGSNYGQESTPGWVYNLEAEPAATIEYRERAITATARRADATETDQAFDLGSRFYPGFAKYRTRANRRVIRVFVLDVADQSDGSLPGARRRFT